MVIRDWSNSSHIAWFIRNEHYFEHSSFVENKTYAQQIPI